MKYLLIAIVLLAACTTTHYSKIEGDSKVVVDHFSLGMEREGIDLSLSRKPDEMIVGVKVGRSSGKESMDRAISAVEKTLETLRAMKP